VKQVVVWQEKLRSKYERERERRERKTKKSVNQRGNEEKGPISSL
jgi:hypothetical protein